MPSADLLIPFLLASAAFACVPGPGMLYAAARTLASGRRAGWWSALGFHLAGLGHVAAAAVGISVLLAVVPPLFTAMKLAGGIWLVWLGIRYLRTARSPAPVQHQPVGRSALRDAVIAEAMNPKSALFYLAFLPQFTDPTAAFPVWLQIAVLGLVANVLFSATDLILIELSHVIGRRLRSAETLGRAARRLGGGILIGLGIDLALARVE